jgi:hypothetical protein
MIDLVTFGGLLSAAVILMAWSGLYRTTKLYSTSESLVIGLYLGFMFAEGLRSLSAKVFTPLFLRGQWMSDLTILLFLGLLYYTRLFRGKEWPSRIPMAILAGIATGLAVRGAIYAQIVQQLIVGSLIGKTVFGTFNNILIVIITFTALSYMIYTREHKGPLRISSRIGRLGLMIAFGWTLGTYLMSLISFAIGQIGILATPPGLYLTIPALLLIGVDIVRRTRA